MKTRTAMALAGALMIITMSCRHAVIGTEVGAYNGRFGGSVAVRGDTGSNGIVALSLLGALVGSAIYADSHQYKAEGLSAIDVNIRPKDAEISLDGVVVGTADQFDGFPRFLVVNPGKHEITARKTGYRTYRVKVAVAPGQQVNLNKVMEPGYDVSNVKPAPQQTPSSKPVPSRVATPLKVYFQINNPDAAVYVDGVFVGTAHEISQLHGPLMVDRGAKRITVLTANRKKVFLISDLMVDNREGIIHLKVDM
ncbi:MAG: PEGA domain-containing protein [Acidobacteria bacterium]|nr:PEGA domain-containing protein [Acidobacteriota bacterium]